MNYWYMVTWTLLLCGGMDCSIFDLNLCILFVCFFFQFCIYKAYIVCLHVLVLVGIDIIVPTLWCGVLTAARVEGK